MQITLERSGGFTGMPLTLTVDTADLSAEPAQQLRQWVEMADFFNLPAALATPPQPDRFEYEVTIREGDRTHSVTFGDAAVPESLKPLMEGLMKMARQL